MTCRAPAAGCCWLEPTAAAGCLQEPTAAVAEACMTAQQVNALRHAAENTASQITVLLRLSLQKVHDSIDCTG